MKGVLIRSPPTMWWRFIVLVLSIFVIIIIIQQFDDVSTIQSPIFIKSEKISCTSSDGLSCLSLTIS